MEIFMRPNRSIIVTICTLFFLALSFRLVFLFFASGLDYVGWYHDSFHHWQIAYYTLHVGLNQDPPRMWDLNGQEYFWGILPTLTESFLLWVFNTKSIAPFRIFNAIMGSVSTCLIYFLGKKYFGQSAGLMAAILAATSPIFMEVDTSGMLDPMGVTFLLLALLVYNRNTFLCGFFGGLASLCHIEFWFLALAIIGCYLIFERSGLKLIPAIIGWMVPLTPYLYFVQSRTGDALYALRWNYLGNIAGEWIKPPFQVSLQSQIVPRTVAVAALVCSVAAIVYLLRRKPRAYHVHTFFLTFVAMKGLIFGLTPYGLPYIAMNQMGRVLIDRLFALNYYYAFLLAAVGINLLSKKLQPTSRGISLMHKIPSTKCVVFFLVLLISISVFPYVTQEYFSPIYSLPYGGQHQLADIIMSHYQGGTVVSSLVIVNYQLINRGIPHENVLGSLYIPSDDIMEAYRWLGKHNVSWFIGDDNMLRSFSFLSVTGSIEEHPIFRQSRESIVVYSVNQSELQRLIQGKSP